MNTPQKINSGSLSEKIALWIFVVYLLINSTKVFSFWKKDRGAYEVDNISGNFALAVAGNLIFLVILFQLYRKRHLFFEFFKENWAILLVYIFALISVFWSQVPFVAFRRWIKVSILLFALVNILTYNRKSNLFYKAILTYITIVVTISFVVILFLPQYGWMQYGGQSLPQGILGHKSALSDFGAVSFLFLLWIYLNWEVQEKKPKTLLFSLMISSLALLISAQGKNPLINICAALAIIGFLYLTKAKFSFTLSATLVSLMGFFSVLYLYLVFEDILPDPLEFVLLITNKDSTLTGRTVLWDTLLYLGTENHFWLGSGFGSFFLGADSAWLENYLEWSSNDPHSNYLSFFLELGISGLIIFLFSILYLLFKILNFKGSMRQKSMMYGFLTYAVFYGIASTTFFSLRLSSMIIVWLYFQLSQYRGITDNEMRNRNPI